MCAWPVRIVLRCERPGTNLSFRILPPLNADVLLVCLFSSLWPSDPRAPKDRFEISPNQVRHACQSSCMLFESLLKAASPHTGVGRVTSPSRYRVMPVKSAARCHTIGLHAQSMTWSCHDFYTKLHTYMVVISMQTCNLNTTPNTG